MSVLPVAVSAKTLKDKVGKGNYSVFVFLLLVHFLPVTDALAVSRLL